ncbi:MAG: PIN domain-containing protein [Bacteroidota bacterium]
MDLVDTNVFIEILLQQPKAAICANYLRNHAGQFYLSTFSLHSIGVLLFKKKQPQVFDQFLIDFPPATFCLPLSTQGYSQLSSIQSQFNLDFDDAFQFATAKENMLRLVTQDADFRRVGNAIQVLFL